jgi:deuterolysin
MTSTGGIMDLFSVSRFSFAELNSTIVSKTSVVQSNAIIVNVNGAEAATAREAYLPDQVTTDFITQGECSSVQAEIIADTRQICRERALMGALYSGVHFSKMREYFKDDSPETRRKVGQAFDEIFQECASTTEGRTDLHCQDTDNWCNRLKAAAYGYPGGQDITYCPRFFSEKAYGGEGDCHAYDRGLTMIHELSHNLASTRDIAYGYDNIMQLSSEQALNNARTLMASSRKAS